MDLKIIQMVECPWKCEPVDLEACAECIMNNHVGSELITCYWEEIGKPAGERAWKEVCLPCLSNKPGKPECHSYQDRDTCPELEQRFLEILREMAIEAGLVEGR